MYAVIDLPQFALQAVLRTEPEMAGCPVVLFDPAQPKAGVWQQTRAAREAGIVEGLTLTQATARCREVQVRHRSLAQERAAAEVLHQVAYAFSPRIEATAEGACTMDLQGLRQAGDEAWGRTLLHHLETLQLRGRIGVAAHPDLARHAAQCARPFLQVEDASTFLQALPIEQLAPTPETLAVLRKWGIRTWGELTALGRAPLAERLDREALLLYGRATLGTPRPLRLLAPPETYEETLTFEQAVETLEPLLAVLRRFLDALCRRMALAYRVVETLDLGLGLTSGTRVEHVFRIPAPTCDPAALFRMVLTHLETVRTEHPISHVWLRALPCWPPQQQFDLFASTLRDPNRFADTLNRLQALLGQGRVGTPVLEDSHHPDRFRLVCQPTPTADSSPQRGAPAHSLQTHPACGLVLRRLRPPQRATIEWRDARPFFVRSERYQGCVVYASGPWQSSGQWWEAPGWTREEWDVRTRSGDIYRLLQQEGEWFIEGIYG